MDYNPYENVMWQYKTKKWKPPKEPQVDIEEKNDPFTDISNDTMLVAKQFMVFAHLRCPKPPVRFARGLLSSTIRVEPTYYLGMNGCVCKCGNAQAFYMPFTNEEWLSAKAYPVGKDNFYSHRHMFGFGGNWKKTAEEYWRTMKGYYPDGYEDNFKDWFKKYDSERRSSLVRKNPNEHWWDKAVEDTVNLCQERGVMMNG